MGSVGRVPPTLGEPGDIVYVVPLTFVTAIFSARLYISRLCYDVSVFLSVRLSVTEVHWRIVANFGFKFRSTFPRIAAARPTPCSTAAMLLAVLLAGESSRAMLASARSSATCEPLDAAESQDERTLRL